MAMAVLPPSCAILCLLLLSFLPGEISRLVSARIDEESLIHAPIPRRTWCIAKPSASEEALREAIDYACRMTDCGPVHATGICFQPDTKANHASFAINSYYQTRGANKWNCDFSNTGLIALTDPSSYGCCQFKGSVPKATLPKKQDTWCVAKAGTPDKMLQANIDYACGELGDCSDIQEQGSCFFPNTLISHASVIMNLYYKTVGKYHRCNFNNTGVIVVSNPDSGECLYV